jgi:hypothetical protein
MAAFGTPPKKKASSIRTFHARNVRRARSWAGFVSVSNQRDPNRRFGWVRFLDPRQRFQDVGKRPRRQFASGILTFVFKKCLQPLDVVDPLSFVREQLAIPVESDADLRQRFGR